MLVVKPVDELLWIVDCELVKGYSLSVLGAGDHIPEGVCISLETKEVFDEIIELAWDYPKDLEHFIFDWIGYSYRFPVSVNYRQAFSGRLRQAAAFP